MPGTALAATSDVNAIEAPIRFKEVLLCAFGAFGGIFFGYDSGYINGVLGIQAFIDQFQAPGASAISDSNTSAIVSTLSAGTFFGALIAGDVADIIGRKWTVIIGCIIYAIGVILQTAASSIGLLVAGRVVAGLGVGFESAIVILYMSEICPRKIRGALVSCYQFAITLGLLISACVTYATQDRTDSGAYRIPIAIQFLWAIILGVGLLFLPDSPRFFVKRGRIEQARASLARLRGQSGNSEFVEAELAEIIANEEYERQIIPAGSWIKGWTNCFSGSVFKSNSNLRKTILGTSLQMMQQWTGVNFIFYFSTSFLQSTGAIDNVFLISLIFTLVNVCSTPISFYTMEKFGRRPLLIWGAFGMTICQLIVAAVGVTVGFNKTYPNPTPTDPNAVTPYNIAAVRAQVAFISIFIFFFASTWGPGAWVLIGEVFPLPIRSRGVALSTASNWLWNTIITVITPYLVGAQHANLKSNVFWLWMSLCAMACLYAYLFVPETKGLSLEQVDKMMEETSPRTSSKWKATKTFASEMGLKDNKLDVGITEDIERKGSIF